MTETWWLSFCDPDLPQGKQFLGVIIIDAESFLMAHMHINLLGINPGGEIEGHDITIARHRIKPEYKNRLLKTIAECDLAIKKEG
jgi:hypothetical protein